MTIYRYLGAEAAVATIESGYLKTSRYFDFNDPFELAWQPTFTSESIDNYAERLLSKPDFEAITGVNPNAVRRKKLFSDPIFRDKLIAEHEIMVTEHRDPAKKYADFAARIICFSSDKARPEDEIMMWSHYTDKNSGLRLGFNLSARKDTLLVPMKYDSEMPKADPYQNINLFSKEIQETLTRKSSVWAYENEVRLLAFPEHCFSVKMKNGELADCIKYADDELISVTIGTRYKGEIVELVSNIRKRNPKAEIFKAKLHLREYKFEYEPIS